MRERSLPSCTASTEFLRFDLRLVSSSSSEPSKSLAAMAITGSEEDDVKEMRRFSSSSSSSEPLIEPGRLPMPFMSADMRRMTCMDLRRSSVRTAAVEDQATLLLLGRGVADCVSASDAAWEDTRDTTGTPPPPAASLNEILTLCGRGVTPKLRSTFKAISSTLLSMATKWDFSSWAKTLPTSTAVSGWACAAGSAPALAARESPPTSLSWTEAGRLSLRACCLGLSEGRGERPGGRSMAKGRRARPALEP
mmetsp:Transcript_82146/g.241174  ORF Transcript_82146/g.241174 Transcript_82146/m.241174 type:complete len:251 (+) Transcript_82146:1520-2272(+)